MRVVIDTNVLLSALRSRRGASFQLVEKLGSTVFQPIVSPPLCLEYEGVLRRPGLLSDYSPQDLDDFLDYLLSVSIECQVHYLWRPYLPDPKDDMVLELALAGDAQFIVTHNIRDFPGIQALGVRAVTPSEFLSMLRP